MEAVYLSETLALYYPDARYHNLENHNMDNININITALTYIKIQSLSTSRAHIGENRGTAPLILNLGTKRR